jgi:hypothetical protein
MAKISKIINTQNPKRNNLNLDGEKKKTHARMNTQVIITGKVKAYEL